jgi:hypothetical protein
MEAKAGASNENMLSIFQEDITNYGSIKENCTWRSRYNHELYKLYKEPNKVKVIKVGRMNNWDAFLKCRSTILAGS